MDRSLLTITHMTHVRKKTHKLKSQGKGREKEYQLIVRQWWHTTLFLAHRRQRQKDLYELEASLVYRRSSRIDRATQRNLVSGGGGKNSSTKRKDDECSRSASSTQYILGQPGWTLCHINEFVSKYRSRKHENTLLQPHNLRGGNRLTWFKTILIYRISSKPGL